MQSQGKVDFTHTFQFPGQPANRDGMINVLLNGRDTNLIPETSLAQLLESENMAERKGIAVAVNSQVVRRQDWSSCILRENDKIIIIAAVQGG